MTTKERETCFCDRQFITRRRLREFVADAMSTCWNFPGKHPFTNNTVVLIPRGHHAQGFTNVFRHPHASLLRSHHSAFSLLFHAYPRPSPNSPYARSQNCIYHRYIYSPRLTRLLQFSLPQHRRLPNNPPPSYPECSRPCCY